MVSDRQQEAVAKMREGLIRRYTCQRCGYYDPSHGKQKYAKEIRQRWCVDCWFDYERYELKIEQSAWARKYREQGSFVVLDSETTGLELSDEVIELGIVDGHTGVVLFNSLIQPEDMHRDGLATHIHGITREMLDGAPRFPDVWPEIQKILDQRRVLVYNADFDFGMLRQTAKRYGYQMPDGYRYWECLMHQYARYYGVWSSYWHGYGWCKLDQACRDLEVASDGTSHRALADAMRALGVLNGMADREPIWDGVKPELPESFQGIGNDDADFADHPF
jgi:DNA polymerase III epsilon subunit-like protein